MTAINTSARNDAASILTGWLNEFSRALASGNTNRAAGLFLEDGHWKDLLAFTWEHRSFSGRNAISRALEATLATAAPSQFRISPDRSSPVRTRRARRDVVEGYFDFETRDGHGSAFVRISVPDSPTDKPLAWILLTTLQSLHGFEEKRGRFRPTGDEYARNATGRSWKDDYETRCAYADREPEVLVIGAGHAGLVAAARLSQMGVDALVVERTARVGDVWRNRYHSLTLHNELMANHLPYMSYPETWPVWLTKDQLADWLEAYANCMALNVWTSTEIQTVEWSQSECCWLVELRRDGEARRMRVPHIVVATGVSGSIPHYGKPAGLEDFKGEVLHSSEYVDGRPYAGRNAIVVGTGNSAHDIAHDLHVKNAASVSLLQRGPTCVISLQPGAEMIYRIYGAGLPIEDVDLMAASLPYPVLEDAYRNITRKAADYDRELLERLNERGFRTYFGSDGTGFQMMYMRGEGGYYINVGCSELICNGDIGVLQTTDSERFEAEGLRMKSGELIPADLVVLATGFKNMQENIRAIFGDEIAERVGPVWGFDEHHQMRGMWRRTGQEGLWITGGSLLDSRIFSRFMAIEITAALNGRLPAREKLPLARTLVHEPAE